MSEMGNLEEGAGWINFLKGQMYSTTANMTFKWFLVFLGSVASASNLRTPNQHWVDYASSLQEDTTRGQGTKCTTTCTKNRKTKIETCNTDCQPLPSLEVPKADGSDSSDKE
jgi:hypothetical protein